MTAACVTGSVIGALAEGEVDADDFCTGLLTPRVRYRYEEAGIPVSEDARIILAMEGGDLVAA